MVEKMEEESEKECWLEEFKEVNEVNLLVDNIYETVGDQIKTELALERFNFVISQYQEQPHLLDSHLKQLFDKLLTVLKNNITKKHLTHLACKFLYILVKTRGYKVVSCMLPHEVTDLSPIISILNLEDPYDFEGFECKYICLLWLSIVCLIPFHLSRFDDVATTTKTTVDIIFDLSKLYLGSNNRCQDVCGLVVARFLSRPDIKTTKLPLFIDWAIEQLNVKSEGGIMEVSMKMGVLIASASLFKYGPRDHLLLYGERVLHEITNLKLNEDSNTKIRKLSLKVIQRVGLVYLKPRLASWRYQRGSRSLVENLKSSPMTTSSSSSHPAGSGDVVQQDNGGDDDDDDVPPIIENVLEILLMGLKDKDTSCRWSSAKGIGRLTSRLPFSLAEEVLSSVMELFQSGSNEDAWHGGCLCLGELGHRGALLPRKLDEVVKIVIRSLNYEERHGTCSVGSNVRDAASFVCWSFARAYDPFILANYINSIVTSLLITSLFDREVKVRRAASAAMQELIGRQAHVPHGIDLITSCDYFAVGNRNNCYLHLSKLLSQYEEYKEPILEHLLYCKLSHWDLNIRELVGEALGLLVDGSFDYFMKSGLRYLLKESTSTDPYTRHGGMVSSGHVIVSMATYAKSVNKSINDILDEDVIKTIHGVINEISSMNYFRGHHGDMMRRSCCFYVKQISVSNLSLPSPIIDGWMSLLTDCLHNPDPSVQECAVDASSHFIEEYFKEDVNQLNELLVSYKKELLNVNAYVRCAYCRVLGNLPTFALMLNHTEHRLLQQLLQHCIHPTILHASSAVTSIVVPFQPADTTIEERKEAILSLAMLCKKPGVLGSQLIGEFEMKVIYQVLFISINDYTVDDRGDVGAWVREACMQALHDVTVATLVNHPHFFNPSICLQLFQNLIQQSCEKIDRTRSVAGNIFSKLLYHYPPVPHISDLEKLKVIFKYDDVSVINWSSPGHTFPLFVQLLSSHYYSYNLLLGLVISVGGLTESLVKCSGESLITHLKLASRDELNEFCSVFIRVFEDHHKVDRVIIPTFKTIDKLLTSDCFVNMDPTPKKEFMMHLVKLSMNEINKCRDVKKILPSIDVFCGLMQQCSDVRGECLSRLMILMCHGFPIIRKVSASRLYETFMTCSDDLIRDDAIDDVTDLLVNTNWDQDVSQVRPIRNKLCHLLGVPTPILIKTT